MIHSVGFALAGLRRVLGERNMRIHLCVAFYVVIAGIITRNTHAQWGITSISISMVIAAECFNCAIEDLCDALHPGWSVKIGAVKDLAAGAVLVCAVSAIVVGALIFFNEEKIHRAMVFARFHPALAVICVFLLPIWGYYIFRRTNK